MKLQNILKKGAITMDDLREVVTTLEEMKHNTEIFIKDKAGILSDNAKRELLSDIGVMRTYIELTMDQGEDDLKNQENIFDFLVILYNAMEGTNYKSKILPVAHSLGGI